MNRTLKGLILINAIGIALFVVLVAFAPPRIEREAGPSAFPSTQTPVGPTGADAGRPG